MLPKDPVMLLSFVNMKLRDFYTDIESFCMDYDMEVEVLEHKLGQLEYQYDRALNRFVPV